MINIAVAAPDADEPFYGVWRRFGFDAVDIVAECDTWQEADAICVRLAMHYRCKAYPNKGATPPSEVREAQ